MHLTAGTCPHGRALGRRSCYPWLFSAHLRAVTTMVRTHQALM
jgi:hypothetical protein